jgi:hypothetical protein
MIVAGEPESGPVIVIQAVGEPWRFVRLSRG